MSADGNEQRLDEDEALSVIFGLKFFKPFSREEKFELATFTEYKVHYTRGQFVIREGGPNNCLYVLLSGAVVINKSVAPHFNLAKLAPGDVFGEIAFLLDPPTRLTNVVAVENVSVLRLDNAILSQLGPELQVKFKDQLLRLLVNKLDTMNKILIDHVRLL